MASKVESYLSLCECCWKPLEGDVDLKRANETSIWEILQSQVLSAKRDGLIIAHTCGVRGLETLPLHRGIRNEAEVHLVSCGDQLLWDLTATQSPQYGRRVAVPVERLQMVVCTLLVLLDLKLVEGL